HPPLIEASAAYKQAPGPRCQPALGGGDGHGSEATKAAAAASPAADAIKFLGFVPDRELPDLYRSAHCMVYPSLFEGFGLPPVEAMACGIPVISSTRGALEEVVADAALTIDPEDVPDLTNALTRFAAEPALAADLRTKGLANAARFHWQRTAAQVTAVYAKAAARP
ncbi:MAG: glycosyltransferase family 4 protein, partial [Akkermansiaceae bacterium]|nr:glycosyltransferase family 4 protein [Akkermansiaceae bacterium]